MYDRTLVLDILHQFLVVTVEFDLFESGHAVVLIAGGESAAKVGAWGGIVSGWRSGVNVARGNPSPVTQLGLHLGFTLGVTVLWRVARRGVGSQVSGPCWNGAVPEMARDPGR